MITHLSIKNFKLFEDQFFTFSNLNLLTGINGFGKSSLIQLLLLLRESKLDRGLLTEGITLSGNKLFNMRQASDALRVGAKEPFQIEIDLGIDNQSNILVLDASKDKSNQLTIIDNKTKINKKTFDDCELFKENTFVYLNANRIDPAHNSYGNAGEGVKNKFGNDGRASISFYQNNLGFVVDEKLCKQGTSDLPTQVKYWLQEITPSIVVHTVPNADKTDLFYSFGNSDAKFTPSNVGFGVTHTLPVIISLLSAQPKDIIIIENPEAHLHPKGQSKLAELMCLVAQNGVQIFCETHSDHIVNACRVAVKTFAKTQEGLSSENLNVYFFGKNYQTQGNEISFIKADSIGKLLKVTPKGKTTNLPKGFFDEWANSMSKLV